MNSIFTPGPSGNTSHVTTNITETTADRPVEDSSVGRSGLSIVPHAWKNKSPDTRNVSWNSGNGKEPSGVKKTKHDKGVGLEERSESEKGKGQVKGKTRKDEDIREFKDHLKILMGLLPVVEKMKEAYDAFN